ncbi:MAG: glycosyltransferase family 2 protein [Gemmatimonas sp.]
MTRATVLSVVMPAYNEEGAIEAATSEVREFVLDRIPGSELVVVNDGSRDQTGPILKRIADADPRVRVLHRANGGHGPALRAAIDAAHGDSFFLIDSDRQIPLSEFEPLWDAVRNGSDAAFGVRSHRADHPARILLTRAIRSVLPVLFGVRVRDANVPFKLLKRHVWEAARSHIPEDTLAPSLFLSVFAVRRGFTITYVPVSHRDRETGVVSIRRWKLIKFCAQAFRQLLAFRWSLSR